MPAELMTNPNGGFSNELPIGTVKEVEAAGMDPSKVRCCAEEKKGSGILACKASGACPFDRPRYGGFKNVAGPQFIAAEIITGDILPSGEPAIQQMEIPCHLWVTKWQQRAVFGKMQRDENKPGEIISIVGFQGDFYESQIQMPINVNGEVINQSRRMFDVLEQHNPGIKFNREDRRAPHDYQMFNVKQVVSTFPRPGERKASSYAQRMLEKANQRMAQDREIEDAVVTARRKPSEEQLDDVVKRGPGRPKKDGIVLAESAE